MRTAPRWACGHGCEVIGAGSARPGEVFRSTVGVKRQRCDPTLAGADGAQESDITILLGY